MERDQAAAVALPYSRVDLAHRRFRGDLPRLAVNVRPQQPPMRPARIRYRPCRRVERRDFRDRVAVSSPAEAGLQPCGGALENPQAVGGRELCQSLLAAGGGGGEPDSLGGVPGTVPIGRTRHRQRHSARLKRLRHKHGVAKLRVGGGCECLTERAERLEPRLALVRLELVERRLERRLELRPARRPLRTCHGHCHGHCSAAGAAAGRLGSLSLTRRRRQRLGRRRRRRRRLLDVSWNGLQPTGRCCCPPPLRHLAAKAPPLLRLTARPARVRLPLLGCARHRPRHRHRRLLLRVTVDRGVIECWCRGPQPPAPPLSSVQLGAVWPRVTRQTRIV